MRCLELWLCVSSGTRQKTTTQASRHEPEVCPQVHNLPAPETNEQEGRAKAKPLDTRVGALVGVAQLLLAHAQVVHLLDNLAQHLLDAPQLSLDWLELLVGLNRRPVLGIGADIDIQLNVAEAVLAATVRQVVLKADVKRRVCVRREDGALLAGNVLGPAVLVADGILDLGLLVFLNPSKPVTHRCSVVHTCMFTTWPSPFWPLTVAVTTTSVSLVTKLRMQRGWPFV